MASPDPSLDRAIEALIARHPDAAGRVDQRARARLAEVLADPDGQSWMEPAGLLDGDSCGYPVEGGYYDVSAELAVLPAASDPSVRDRVLARLRQQWADDYVLTGRARLDRPWRSYVESA
jgi:hypothetical protein